MAEPQDPRIALNMGCVGSAAAAAHPELAAE
jgi:hypothetical protein